MTCIKKITQSISNSCRSVRGLKPRALWAYRTDCTFTFSGNVITAVSCPVLGVWEGVKYSLNAGHEAVVAEDNGTGYKHKFNAIVNVNGQVDGLDDIVVFVQTSSGSWLAYGATQGLWNATQTSMSNDNLATTTIELASLDGREELYEDYSVTADLSIISTTDDKLVFRLSYAVGEEIHLGNTASMSMKLYDSNGVELQSDDATIQHTASYAGEYLFVCNKQVTFSDIYFLQGNTLSKSISLEGCSGTFAFVDTSLEHIQASRYSLTISDCPNIKSVTFEGSLNATNANLTVSAIERILIDRVAKGTVCDIDFSGTNPSIDLWSSAAVAAKDALVDLGCTIIYELAP